MNGALRTARILWSAISGSIVILYGVLQIARPPDPPPMAPIMLPVLGLVGLTVAVMSFVLPRFLLGQGLAQQTFETRDEADPSGGERTYRGQIAKRRVFADPAKVVGYAARLYPTKLILSIALSEAVALFGFVIGFLGGPPAVAAAFFAVGLVLALARFPTRNAMLGPIEAHFGAKLP